MRMFQFTFGGPDEVTATLDDPGDIQTSTDELPLTITVENHTDTDLVATSVKITMEQTKLSRRNSSSGTKNSVTRNVNTTIPARSTTQLAAQAGPRARTPGHERAILAYAWDKGSRNALLADRYSHRILADGSPDPARPHLDQAAQVCIDALAAKGTSTASVYDRLTDRLQRIRTRKANPPKPPPNFTRNARKPRTSRLTITAQP